jgi:membrane protein required for colicin V production
MEGFNYMDIIVVFIIVLLGLKGYINGFLKEVFTLIGIIGGIFIASRYSYEIGQFLHENLFEFAHDGKKNFAGFLVGIIGFWAGTTALRYAIEAASSDTAFSAVNKILGILVSSGKMFLILAVISHAASSIEFINKNIKEFTKDSIMYPILKDTGAYIIKVDIEDFKKKETVASTIDNVTNSVTSKLDDIKESTADSIDKIKDNIK